MRDDVPGEILTFKHYRCWHSRCNAYCTVRSDKRTLYGAQRVYHLGLSEPNYPVPAIREGFEFGRNFLTKEVVMLTWKQGRYDG